MSTATRTNYYDVLGVTIDATPDQIKKAYRKLVLQVHPDRLGPDATAVEISLANQLMSDLGLANEHLSDETKRAAYDRLINASSATFQWDSASSGFSHWEDRTRTVIPDPEEVVVDGITVRLVYSTNYWYGPVSVTVHINVRDIFTLDNLENLPCDVYVKGVAVTADDGEVIGRSWSIMGARNEMNVMRARLRRNKERIEWRAQLDEIQQAGQRLAREGIPIHTLTDALCTARILVDSGELGDHWWNKAADSSKVIQSIKAAQKELIRLQAGDAAELLLEDLLTGRIKHPDLDYNARLFARLDVYHIRTGGEFGPPNVEVLQAFYRKRLAGASTMLGVLSLDLKWEDEESTILECAKEGVVSLAPDTVQIAGNKRPVAYPVTYGRAKVENKVIPVGIITVPESVYERDAAQYGRTSGLPTLPHGITLLVRVKVQIQGRVVTSDPRPDGKLLQNEVQRCRARLRNPKPVDETSSAIVWPASFLGGGGYDWEF